MDKLRQNIQLVKNDIWRKEYNLERVNESEKNSSRKKRVKKLLKRISKEKGDSTKDRMLTFFELDKELGDDWMDEESKYDKNLAQQIYKSFEKTYPWMLFNKRWKLRYFHQMSIQDTEEIAHSWISIELNPVEKENTYGLI